MHITIIRRVEVHEATQEEAYTCFKLSFWRWRLFVGSCHAVHAGLDVKTTPYLTELDYAGFGLLNLSLFLTDLLFKEETQAQLKLTSC